MDMLLITRGRAKRQYKDGGLPSKTNCSSAVTSNAETMTKPCTQKSSDIKESRVILKLP